MTNVVVVLDPAFGERIRSLLPVAPIWIVSTETNKSAYQSLQHDYMHEDHHKKGTITSFKVFDIRDRVRGLLDVISDVESHYGSVKNKELTFPDGFVLKVIGVSLAKEVTESLRSYGFTSFSKTPDGFQAKRHA